MEITAICAVLALMSPFALLAIQALILSAESPENVPGSRGPLNFVSQVKRTGVQTWGAFVEMPEDGGEVVFRARLENTGPQPLTGLVGRAALPDFFSLVPGRCRYGLDQVAAVPCVGSVLDEGVELPDLQPGSWIHLIFTVEISEDVPGRAYETALRVTSDQTGEIDQSAEVRIPATDAEKAVRDLFSRTEGERGFWGGAPEMAPRSKRLLIAQWTVLSLERAHAFAEVPDGGSASLADLFYERVLEGEVVEVQARVASRPWNLLRKEGVVKQSYEVEAPGESARLRCYTPRPAEHLLKAGEELEIKVIPIAWSPQGSGDELTMALCPAARAIRSDEAQD